MGACFGRMQMQMQNTEALTTEQIEGFLEGNAAIGFAGQSRADIYGWTERTLVAQEYHKQGKKRRGVVRAYIRKVTGLSLPQVTRLIRKHRQSGRVALQAVLRKRFPTKYTEPDVVLLADVDRAHGGLSGPATACILAREHVEFGKQEFVRLAGISPSHIYNLRQKELYRKRNVVYSPTRATAVSIGERRKPDPRGQPGYLRVDTVHQGDWDGAKGVYHINAVDTVTQWQIVGCVSKISEAFLQPVLEAMLHQFPFRILSFHSDNGSEYINHTVAKLLDKLLAEFTKSRANRSQDNALVEGKNGAVIRKQIGYGHIPGEHAEQLQKFYTAQMNPYLNFHRPCGFATISFDARGKRKRRYLHKDYTTPYEKFKSLPLAAEYLKEGLSIGRLDQLARVMSDTECAEKMRQAKIKLLRKCKIECPLPPDLFI